MAGRDLIPSMPFDSSMARRLNREDLEIPSSTIRYAMRRHVVS